jgi:hypothetical protein
MANGLGIVSSERVRFDRPVEYVFAVLSILALVGPICALIALRMTGPYVQNTAMSLARPRSHWSCQVQLRPETRGFRCNLCVSLVILIGPGPPGS